MAAAGKIEVLMMVAVAGPAPLSMDLSYWFSFDSSLAKAAAAAAFTAEIVSIRMEEGGTPITGDTECYFVNILLTC